MSSLPEEFDFHKFYIDKVLSLKPEDIEDIFHVSFFSPDGNFISSIRLEALAFVAVQENPSILNDPRLKNIKPNVRTGVGIPVDNPEMAYNIRLKQAEKVYEEYRNSKKRY